ncbi:MAG: serine hydrolase [Cyanobacteria bacterium P01_F01_bin.150]
MPFFHPDDQLQTLGDRILAQTWQQFPSLARNQLALTWVVYDDPVIVNTGGAVTPNDFWQQTVRGFSYRGVECLDPAELAHLVYLIAIHEWIEQSMIGSSPELERAMQDMVVLGNHGAAGLVVDMLTGTTSGPELPPQPFQTWQQQRNIVNRYLKSLQWPELETVNICQKTTAAYGRERQALGAMLEYRNQLTTDAIARLMHSIVGGVAVSAGRSKSMMGGLHQSRLSFAAQVLPSNSQYWSLIGQDGQGCHEVMYAEVLGMQPFLLAVSVCQDVTQRQAVQNAIIPFLAQRMLDELS